MLQERECNYYGMDSINVKALRILIVLANINCEYGGKLLCILTSTVLHILETTLAWTMW